MRRISSRGIRRGKKKGNNMFKKYVSILLAASMLFVTSLSVCALGGKDSGNMQDTPELSAYYEALDSYLNHMAAADAEYAGCTNCTYSPVTALYSHDLETPTSLLFEFRKNGHYRGYVIVRAADMRILESALCEIPYNIDAKADANVKFVYDFGNHGVSVGGGTPVYITEADATDELQNAYFNYGGGADVCETQETVFSNVPIHFQNSANCIVCACAHLLLYWNRNGYSGLTPTVSTQAQFTSLMEAVDVRFTSYANNKIPGVLSGYADDRGFTVQATNIWDPTLEDAHTEISADRPFLLGFAAGSSYSSTVGHMTVCVGISTTYLEGDYVKVVDGHSSSLVTQYWDDEINDYICSVTVSEN